MQTSQLIFSANHCLDSMRGYCVGNKAEGQISKRWLQENKVRQIFRKANISYPLICIGTEKI